MPIDKPTPPTLSVDQVARLLHISADAVRIKAVAGEFASRFGRYHQDQPGTPGAPMRIYLDGVRHYRHRTPAPAQTRDLGT